MNTKKYLKYSFLPLVLMLGGLAFTACTDDIEGGKPVDEGAYDAVKRVDGMLLDVTSNKNESVIELRSDKYQTEVFFRLTKAPQKGVDVKIEVDPLIWKLIMPSTGRSSSSSPRPMSPSNARASCCWPRTRSVRSGWASPWQQPANCRKG